MERRALIAVVISLAILVFYQEVVLRHLYPPPTGEEEVSEPPTIAPTVSNAPPESGAEQPPSQQVAKQTVAEGHPITVETEFYKAIFTTRGARLESFELKKYRTSVAPDSPLQQMVLTAPGGELPFGVELRGSKVLTDEGAPYTANLKDLNLTGSESGTLEFTWQESGITIQKRFTFQADRYQFSASVDAHNVPDTYNEVGLAWTKAAPPAPPRGTEIIFDHAVFLEGRKLVEDTFDKLAAGKIVSGDVGWAGYGGRYFLAALVPAEATNHRLWLKLHDHTVEEKLLFPLAGGATEQRLDIYVGPKDLDTLDRVGHGLARAVNLGWFGFIAVPFLHVLKLSHGFTGNYGIDIILLTVVIKALFIPLTQKSFRSMREMQKLQPQMTKIRERFKDNAEQMNKEIMELYRRHKVNPLGGCLPMLLQTPVFIGLYEALLNAVELRHTPFMWWINDLSAPDRLGSLQLPFVQHPGVPVLTLLMGVSMFVQQWMTPTAGDPTQQRMMMIMPLVFTFMFVNFPSGLALYWLVNNLLTIAQQYYMNRTSA